MTYLIALYYRLKCVFGVHLWVGTLAGDDINSPVDYYWCLHCQKEQKHSPYKEEQE
jgi:hypothetical protein